MSILSRVHRIVPRHINIIEEIGNASNTARGMQEFGMDNFEYAERLAVRSAQRHKIHVSLEEFCEAQKSVVGNLVRDASERSFVLSRKKFYREVIAPVLGSAFDRKWQQLNEEIGRVAQEMNSASNVVLPNTSHAEAAGLIGSYALNAAPFAAIGGVPFAVTTSTAFGLFATSAVSLPMILAAVCGSAVLSLVGYNARSWLIETAKRKYIDKLEAEIQRKIIGPNLHSGRDQSMKSVLFDGIDQVLFPEGKDVVNA
jgi:hypothetical protein